MKRAAAYIFLFTAFMLPGAITAQEEKPQAQKEITRKDALKAREQKGKEFDQKMEAQRKAHLARQDKATRKRMKKNKRKAERHMLGKDAPFYKRWFRKNSL